MTELAPLGLVANINTTATLYDLPPVTSPFAESSTARSRPLSEISDNSNSDRRRSFARSLQSKSRPTSEVREFKEDAAGPPKRVASASGSDLRTITLNLNEYAAGLSLKSPTGSTGSSASQAPAPPSPTTKPPKPMLPKRPGLIGRISSSGSSKGKDGGVSDSKGVPGVNGSQQKDELKEEAEDDGDDHISPLLVNRRQSLRPSPLSASYADVAKPILSPLPTSASFSSSKSFASSSDLTLPSRPAPKSKPSWLRRASGNSITRPKSRSPANDDLNSSTNSNTSSISSSPSGPTLTASSSLPPVLPPRKGSAGGIMGPPQAPRRSSYANVTAGAGSSRSQLGEGQGRPAFSPAPPPLPSRENVGNIRTRLAAWTSAAQSTSSFSGFTRSESSSSIASTATSPSSMPSQRVSGSAGRVLGHAGSAVQKGWAGFRARGVAGSISSMSQLATSGRRDSLDPSSSYSSGLNRRAGPEMEFPLNDGPIFLEGVVLRPPGQRSGRVFGRELRETGRAWGVYGAGSDEEGLEEYEKRRRACLPAVVIRAVEYLEEWGPKEEGIFRISGRTSHLSRLRKEFDAGADLNLTLCHPADLDPHAVSGIFKTYLRELPSPLLTSELTPKFEDWVRMRNRPGAASRNSSSEDELTELLRKLPNPNWFLLADIVKLLELIPKHSQTNRMTLNALMLSLGPSLNIPGGVLTEFLDRRTELFSAPPPLDSGSADLIDFGDVDIDIAPPVLAAKPEAARSVTPISRHSDESYKTVPLKDERDSGKRKPQLPKKPSLTRLFGSSIGMSSGSAESSYSARKPLDAQPPALSINTSPPPRVDVPLVLTSPLPTFESEMSPVSKGADAEEQATINKPAEAEISPALDVDQPRLPSTPTPIADRFSTTGNSFPSLRNPKSSSSLASLASGAESTNPASVRRRGGPGFFASSGDMGSPSRSHSTHSVATTGGAGTKRKDEDEEVVIEEEGRAERLSAGPGVLA